MPTFQELKQLREYYKNTFSTDSGKRVLANLEQLCFIHSTTFSQIPYITSFNEGKRTVVVQIQNMIAMDLERLRKQLQEQEEQNANG